MINITETITHPQRLSPLTLAYVGDAVYEIYIRQHVVLKGGKPNKLHQRAISFVSAGAQSKIIHYIMQYLTNEEKDIVKRGRNSKSHTVPKNADIIDYRYSTAFEALIGYLYLSNNNERLKQIIGMAINYIEKKDGEFDGG